MRARSDIPDNVVQARWDSPANHSRDNSSPTMPALSDLGSYGVVTQERASQGIIVTTSRLSPDDRLFVDNTRWQLDKAEFDELKTRAGFSTP